MVSWPHTQSSPPAYLSSEIPGPSNSATQWPCGGGTERCPGKPKLDQRRGKVPSHSEKAKTLSFFLPKDVLQTLHRPLGLGTAGL